MLTNVIDPPASATSILRRVFLIYVGLAIVLFIFRYLNGELRYANSDYYLIPWHFTGWAFAASYALVLEFGGRLSIPQRRGTAYRALFLAPALLEIGTNIVQAFALKSESLTLLRSAYILLDSLRLGLLILGILLLRSAYLAHITRLNVPAVELDVPLPSAHEVLPITDTPPILLGRGDGYIDRVIHSVIGRSMKSEHVANFSLTIMLILVMIGGMASFGLWAFTHADRISTLEGERNKLISLQSEMKEVREKLGTEDAKVQLDHLNKFIDQNYSTSPSYEATLNRLSLQSQSNYADIAIRITIAVLTIFLVQIFFSVYKYNRHLAILLAAKAEALELAGNDDDARKELSREAVSIVKEIVPGFGPHPRTPIEEAFRVAERLGKRD